MEEGAIRSSAPCTYSTWKGTNSKILQQVEVSSGQRSRKLVPRARCSAESSQSKLLCRRASLLPTSLSLSHSPVPRLRAEEPLPITHITARTRRHQQSICPGESVGSSPETRVQCQNYWSPQFLPSGVWYFQPTNKVKTPQELKNRYIPVIFHW